jgi:hypothetical protein
MARKLELVTPDGPNALLWDVAETRRQLGGISRRTLERLEIKPIKIGARTFYRPEDVREYVRRVSAA